MSPPAFSLSADAAPVFLAAVAVALLWPLYAYAKKRFIRALEMQLARRVAELTAANHKLALRAAQAEEAQETGKAALAAKDAALGRMGHRLRTPAGVLLGFDDLLAATALTEEQKNYRSHIRNAAESLVSALDEAEQATVDAPPQAAPPRSFSLAGLVPQLEGVFRLDAQKKHLVFRLHYDQSIPPRLIGDAGMVRHALLSLIEHAVRGTERGSVVITISLQNLTRDAAAVYFRIQDSRPGPPLAGELEETRKRVELLGGTLTLDHQAGLGATARFLLTFSLPPPQRQEIPPPEPAPPRFAERRRVARVLVADDHAMTRAIMATLLQKLGVPCVDEAVDGRDALGKAANARYDLILMDCQMPDMDGFAATRAIKRRKDGARIPVIGVTADVIASDITRCFEAGMDDYFTKPVRLGTLESILQKWVEEAPPLTPL